MKARGSTLEYEEGRNKDLIQTYRSILHNCTGHIDIKDVYEKLIRHPAKRFWVSEKRASIVVSQMLKGISIDYMRPERKEMYKEICNRVKQLMKRKPNLSVYELTFEVVSQPAPSFYLTARTAQQIIYKIRRKWYEERKKKLRFATM